MQGLSLNLLPVSFQFPVSSFGLQEGDEESQRHSLYLPTSHCRRGSKKEIKPHPSVYREGKRPRNRTTVKQGQNPHSQQGRLAALRGRGKGPGAAWTLNTLMRQPAECRCSGGSSLSLGLKVSIWRRKGTPFSPPFFRGVNSVLMQ